jgi:hypothetical protein
VIEANLEQSGTYLMSRATLDLPIINSSLSLSPYQQEALDLAVSNSPIALISGEPGSGKTRVGYLALSMAIQHQKSVLLVANNSNILEAYNNLKIRPLRLDKSNNYLESVTIWLRDQFAEPKLNFLSPYLLADSLLETLQNLPNSVRFLNLNLDNLEQKLRLKEELESIFPQTSEARLDLLIYRLQKSSPLLKNREHLRQNYRNLSDQAISQLAESIIETAKIPILGTLNNILETEIKLRQFDLIMIEDSHLLSCKELTIIASMINKLILLGEIINTSSYFTNLFNCLSPAYRVNLPENFRLNNNLARIIFPYFYYSNPYSPPQTFIFFANRLLWFDIRNQEKIYPRLFNFLETLDSTLEIGILTLSNNIKEILQNKFLEHQQNNVFIDILENWIGKECDVLLIICDGIRPTTDQLRLALTRARELIACFGDIEQYEISVFTSLLKSKNFHIEREVTL